ncbi:MAG: amino acid permease [Gemmatimonadetes bacterium]|nr:amino acid permease [Gemmatimonadota bacterium]
MTEVILQAREPRGSDTMLRRVIGPNTIALNAINLSVGSGIFVLPAVVASIMGPTAIYAYLVCGAAMALVLLCFAELGSTISRSGGGYAYIEHAFGPFVAFLAGVLLWFTFGVLSDAAIAAALADTIASIWPAAGTPVARALVLAAFFGTIITANVAGAREGARVAVVLTIIKLVPLAVFVIGCLPSIQPAAVFGGGLPSLESLGKASLVLFFAFTGAETALSPSGEIRDPRRDVPRGIMAGTAGVILIYLAVHVAAQGVLGADLAKEGAAPLVTAATRAMGPWGRTLLLLAAVLSMAGCVAGDLLSMPRTLYATASDGQLPEFLARVHPRFHTPYAAIAVYGGATWFFATVGGFVWLAALASAGLLLVYLAICLAVLKERRSAARAEGGFRIPGGPTVPLLGCALVIALLANAQASEWKPLGGLMAVSAVYYAIRRGAARRAAGTPATPAAGA